MRKHSIVQRRHRSAFTLVEVMLTLCLMVVLAALAWPVLDKPFASRRLRVAADKVRVAWCGARIDAMNSGTIFAFSYEIDGHTFRVAPQATGESSNMTWDSGAIAGSGIATSGKLPDDVSFVASEMSYGSQSSGQLANATAADGEQGWSQPILFFPDGTTSTSQLVLRSQHGRCIEVKLRGLTGVATVGEISSNDEGMSP